MRLLSAKVLETKPTKVALCSLKKELFGPFCLTLSSIAKGKVSLGGSPATGGALKKPTMSQPLGAGISTSALAADLVQGA